MHKSLWRWETVTYTSFTSPELVRQRQLLHLLSLQADCRFLKIWKSISHFIGYPIVCSKIMPREILWPILMINGLYFKLMYSKNNKHWSQWKTIVKHAYFRMKSYINQHRPKTENRGFFCFLFFLTWQKRVNKRMGSTLFNYQNNFPGLLKSIH